MLVRFWGVRGSVASAINSDAIKSKIVKILEYATPADIMTPENINSFVNSLPLSLKGTFGGNTTCVEIRSDNDAIFIIDGGTGLPRLGHQLMTVEQKKEMHINMFMTHSHWDHIQGIMFFGPFFNPVNTVNIYSSMENMHERLQYQTPFTHFPITFDDMGINKKFFYFPEQEEIKVDELYVSSKAVRHPGTAYSYKFRTEDNRSVIFCSDAEFGIDMIENIESYIEFFKNADILIFDTQYTFEESLQKIDWGHSSTSIATDIALKSGVKKLILFHHDPWYDDEKMDAVTIKALKYKELMAPGHLLEIETAYEGMILHL